MKLFCRLGLHDWYYLKVPQIIPGFMRRVCLRCERTDYHEGAKA